MGPRLREFCRQVEAEAVKPNLGPTLYPSPVALATSVAHKEGADLRSRALLSLIGSVGLWVSGSEGEMAALLPKPPLLQQCIQQRVRGNLIDISYIGWGLGTSFETP